MLLFFSKRVIISKTLFATGLKHFKRDNLKIFKNRYWGCHGLAYSIQLLQKEEKNFWKSFSWLWYWKYYRFDCFEYDKTSPYLELNYTNKKVICSYIFCRISKVSWAILWILVTLSLTLHKAYFDNRIQGIGYIPGKNQFISYLIAI